MKFPTMFIVEPYRIFFPLGWLTGLFGVSYWLFISAGWVTGYAPIYHGLIQIELFSSAFAVGFLLTALPKFLRTRTASSAEVWSFLIVYFVLACANLSSALIIAQSSFILFILLLVRFAVLRIKERKALPPFSFFLVAFGLFEGGLGALLLIAPLSMFPLLGQKLLEQGMFLSLSLGIGSFLGPRLMGVVDTENAMVSLPGRTKSNLPLYKSPSIIVCVIGLLILASFFIETGWDREVGLYLRAVTAFFCLARFNVLKIPQSPSITGILVATALWAMPIGILLAAFLPNHEVGMLHITYIGGFGLLILTIGAQVTSSHGGVHRFWQTYKTSFVIIALLTGISVLTRMSATLFPQHYFLLIGIAAFSFDLALVLWGLSVLRYLGSKTDRNHQGIAT